MSTFYDQVLKANIYLQPVLFTAIIVTNILKIRVLCSRVLCTSPCTYYLISYAIISIIYTCLLSPTQVVRALLIGWENTPKGCNIYFFALFTPSYTARAMLVLAAYDRYCSSSTSRRLNSTSTKGRARISIVIGVISVAVYMSPMSFIYYFDATTGLCRQYTSLTVNIYVFSQMALYYTLAPLLMMIFGILTIINIHRHAVRVAPRSLQGGSRRTEGQLARMLLLQVFCHVFLSTPFGIMYFINSFDPSTRTPNIIAIRYISVFWAQCDYFLSFFLYLLSGNLYRQQLRELFKLTKHATGIQIIQQQQIRASARHRTTNEAVLQTVGKNSVPE